MNRFCLASKILPLLALTSAPAWSTIYLDHEEDPIPVFSLQVSMPVGSLLESGDQAGLTSLLADIMDSGTDKLKKQELNDELAKYGASTSFGFGAEDSNLSINFPIIDGKDYKPLMQLIRQNWFNPRFHSEEFAIAKTKLMAALKGSLDNDSALLSGTSRRTRMSRDFGLPVMGLEVLPKLTLSALKQYYEANIRSVNDIWVGVVAPRAARSLTEEFVQTIFAEQGAIKRGPLRVPMKYPHADASRLKPGKRILLIDKPDRAQNLVLLSGLSPGLPVSVQDELVYTFGNHILFDSGMGSYFNEEIRQKRGLAYGVSGAGPIFLSQTAMGLYTNPVHERIDEALQVVASLVDNAFAKGNYFIEMPEENWSRQWQSFRNSYILSRSTPSARLAQRSSVVQGEISWDFLQSKPEDWKVQRPELQKFFATHWKDSSLQLCLVGSAAELKPLVNKYFKGWPVTVISYKDTIKRATYLRP